VAATSAALAGSWSTALAVAAGVFGWIGVADRTSAALWARDNLTS
jgi:hypothetical protein